MMCFMYDITGKIKLTLSILLNQKPIYHNMKKTQIENKKGAQIKY
jgi:hypothetical protein